MCAQKKRSNEKARETERLLRVLFLIHPQSLSASPDEVSKDAKRCNPQEYVCSCDLITVHESYSVSVTPTHFKFSLVYRNYDLPVVILGLSVQLT